MTEIPDIPELRIVRSADLQPHEEVDKSRAHRLIHSLRNEGFLKNPPVVLTMSEQPERYLVLDGANRTTAFQQMGFPHMLVQVAHEGVEIRNWNHALMGDAFERLLRAIGELEGASLRQVSLDQADEQLDRQQAAAYLAKPDGTAVLVSSQERGVVQQVALLGRMVELYARDFRSERTSADNLNGLASVYPDLAGLVVYRTFTVDDVVEVVLQGGLFPSGLTRFLVSPRALRLNFPIAMLADRSSLETKKKALAEWIRRKMDQQRVRYYAESTFLFDE